MTLKAKKAQLPPRETRFLSPLHVVVEKYGEETAQIQGDLSKESLRSLLVSSLFLIPKSGMTESATSRVKELISQEKFMKDTLLSDVRDFTSEVRKDVEKSKEKRKAERERAQKKEAEEKAKKKAKESLEKTKSEVKSKAKLSDDYGVWMRGWTGYGEQSIPSIKIEHVESLPSCQSSETEDTRLSYDGMWLRKYIKYPLRMAMSEIILKKPLDPINFLGFWLLKYRKSQEEAERQRKLIEELNTLRAALRKTTPEDEAEVHYGEGGEEDFTQQDLNFNTYNTLEIIQ